MGEEKHRRIQRSETLAVGALLAVAGGLMDAYTYLCRGVFANAETGNIVLLAIHAAQGEWSKAGTYLVPIFAFFSGILVAEVLRARRPGKSRFHWRHTVLAVEMVLLTAVSRVPQGQWNALVNVTVAFVCALQVESFRKVRGNPFASTMCTGNLRSGTEALYYGLVRRDREALERSACYFGVIACFILGASLGAALCKRMPAGALPAAALFQLAAFFLMCGQEHEF